jgi:hypothetical protein
LNTIEGRPALIRTFIILSCWKSFVFYTPKLTLPCCLLAMVFYVKLIQSWVNKYLTESLMKRVVLTAGELSHCFCNPKQEHKTTKYQLAVILVRRFSSFPFFYFLYLGVRNATVEGPIMRKDASYH